MQAKRINKFIIPSLLSIFSLCIAFYVFYKKPTSSKPSLAIIIVVDQFAYHYLYKIKPFLQGGLKRLLNKGIVFENAHYPYALPTTGPGHATIGTGALPKDHGIIANSWIDEFGKEVKADHDDIVGKSSRNLMVDTLSDQLLLNNWQSIALGWKSRSPIMLAGKLGKAIWFSDKLGQFTSSAAYYKELPAWLIQFNKTNNLIQQNNYTWQLLFPATSAAYNFAYAHDYRFTESPSIIGKTFNKKEGIEDFYEHIGLTPFPNQMIFTLADYIISLNAAKPLVVWLCLASLDKTGHVFGPESIEALDLIYHLDHQLGAFIKNVYQHVDPTKVLLVLTSDHGVAQLPELMAERGFTAARRIDEQQMLARIKKSLTEHFGVQNLIIGFKHPQLYLDQQQLEKLSHEDQIKLIDFIQHELAQEPCIVTSWTANGLQKLPGDYFVQLFKNQLFAGRSGQIIYQIAPYCLIDDYSTGTKHQSPYNYDTHVPLMLYQKNTSKHKNIYDHVTITQLAPTIAQVLEVPRPSASYSPLLSGIS